MYSKMIVNVLKLNKLRSLNLFAWSDEGKKGGKSIKVESKTKPRQRPRLKLLFPFKYQCVGVLDCFKQPSNSCYRSGSELVYCTQLYSPLFAILSLLPVIQMPTIVPTDAFAHATRCLTLT